MNSRLIDLTVLLDRSASMRERTFEALSAFNTLINSPDFEGFEVQFNLTLFDHRHLPVIELADLEDIPDLHLEDFKPQGGCALLDAIGHSVDDVGRRLAETDPAERPGRVVFTTLTVGMENASRHYTLEEVLRRITWQEQNYAWKFHFPIEGLSKVNGSRNAWGPNAITGTSPRTQSV